MASLTTRAAAAVAATRRAFGRPALIALQAASFAWSAADAAYLVGLLVVAFVEGGPAAVALVNLARTLPSVVVAPLVTGSRWLARPDGAVRGLLLVRLGAVGIAGGLLAGDVPLLAVLAAITVDGIAATLLRPLRGALLPDLARTPEELVAGNVALTTGDSAAGLLGPALAALLLVVAPPAATFVAAGALFVGAFVAASAISTDRRRAQPTRASRPPIPSAAARSTLLGTPAAALIAVITAQRFVRGMVTVLVVSTAFELLAMGEPGVGVLTAAMGFGGLIGGVTAVALIGGRRYAAALVLGVAVWAGSIALPAVVPSVAVAVAAFVIGGAGKVTLDVAGFSLLQRSVPTEQRARVLGVLEGLITAALAGGSIAASLAVEWLGVRVALVLAFTIPLAVAALAWPALRRAEAGTTRADARHALLDRIPMFRPLPLTIRDELAEAMSSVEMRTGDVSTREGEHGDRFYLIETGRVEVTVAGGAVRTLGAGDSFGEIALVRDIPRTSTVTATEDGRLWAIDRATFLGAITGHGESRAAAEAVIRERLAATAM